MVLLIETSKFEKKGSFKDMTNSWLSGAGWGVTANGYEVSFGVTKTSRISW